MSENDRPDDGGLQIRYTVPRDSESAVEQYQTDPWVYALVNSAADMACAEHGDGLAIQPTDILERQHRESYVLPAVLLGVALGTPAERVNQATPENVTAE